MFQDRQGNMCIQKFAPYVLQRASEEYNIADAVRPENENPLGVHYNIKAFPLSEIYNWPVFHF